MTDLLRNSGLLSASLWVGAVAFLSVLVAWWRGRKGNGARVPPFSSLPFLAFIGVCACANLGLNLLKGYVAPRDVLQDVVSAREFLAGRSLYPERMNELMRKELPPEPWLPAFVPESLRQKFVERRKEVFEEHWVQAHPPLMTLLVTPFVLLGGFLATQAALVLLSLAAVGLSVWLVVRGLELDLSGRQVFVFLMAVLVADPVTDAFRLGQSGLILGALMIAGWYALRRDRPVLAGMAIGLAASIKMFPGLLMVYLLCRHRKALLSGVVAVAALAVCAGLGAG